jgi:hypothetical protein
MLFPVLEQRHWKLVGEGAIKPDLGASVRPIGGELDHLATHVGQYHCWRVGRDAHLGAGLLQNFRPAG